MSVPTRVSLGLARKKIEQDLLLNYRLAYLSETEVNWCADLGTVLANDEIINGVSDRGGYQVTKKKMKQWSMRIGAYAERLLEGLEKIDWPDSLKEMQRNWIGKSIGAEIDFQLSSFDKKIKIFTTRPDSIYGASFIAISVNHQIVSNLLDKSEILKIKEQFNGIEYDKEKIGIPLGINCINPITDDLIPLYIANFVLDNYGE